MSGPKECLKCGLLNPPGTRRCDCGYDLQEGPKECPKCGAVNPPGTRWCDCGHDLTMESTWFGLTQGYQADPKGHQWEVGYSAETLIMWRRRKRPLPPGTSWWKKTFSPPLGPVYQGSRHSDVVIRRVEAEAPAVQLPHDFAKVFREELKQGLLKAGYKVQMAESAKREASSEESASRGADTVKHLIVDVDVLEYANPGFLAASLLAFTAKAILRVGFSFFDEGQTKPFAFAVAERSASRYGLMSVVLHIASSITRSMAAILRGICVEVPQEIKKQGI